MTRTDAPHTSRKRDRSVPRDEVPVVEYSRPRCPHCGSTRLRADRSVTDGDGTVTRYSRCQDCREKLCVIAL